MDKQKRLFLLDAYALIFRGYYAFIKNPRINSKGLDTSAILGFTNSLLDVIKRERPDHLAVCFDKGGSTDRIEMFPDYKANRDETPEGIKVAVPYIYKILEAMHIPIMVKEGYEARVFKILDRLVASIPIFGPNAVEGVPLVGSMLNNVKAVVIVAPNFDASSLYIF